MFKRDNEAEGTFGDLKENMGYDRLYRRGHDNVQMEMYLVAMGHNIRRYQKLKKRIKETEEKQMKQIKERFKGKKKRTVTLKIVINTTYSLQSLLIFS